MRKSRLSGYKQSKLIELVIADSTARTASTLVGVNKTTASYYFQRLRQLIYDHSEHFKAFEGEIEVDEFYFGGHRKGKHGRGAAGKVPVFGLLKRNGKVYTDTYKSYNALDVSEFRHFCINHSNSREQLRTLKQLVKGELT